MKNVMQETSSVSELSVEDISKVAGARFKRPLQRPVTVYYDDGVNILTDDPASTNLHVQIA